MDVTAGVHIANSKSIMVIDAGRRGSRAAYAVRVEIDRTQRLCAVDESALMLLFRQWRPIETMVGRSTIHRSQWL
jgi:hypothetical protein